MRRVLGVVVVLAVSGLGVFVPTMAVPGPTRTLAVGGTGVGMYPDFDPSITRYAATTTSATGGTLEVTASTEDPAGVVLVDGRPTASTTSTVAGLAAGDEVSVIIDDAAGRDAYSIMYLPADFPTLTVTVDEPGQQPGLVALTLNAFNFGAPQPSFETIVDRNGVPVFAAVGDGSGLDLKQQPNGEITVSRPTTLPGHTGTSLVTLDDQFAESARRDVVAPLTDTDPHDSVRLPDGSTVLIGYEPNADTGKTDATIQKLDPADNETFRWSSAPYAGETMTPANADYAHVNSVVSVADGDVIASFRHLSAAYRIATVAHDGYQPGDVIWKLGGRDSDFTFVDDPYPGGPCAQHTVSELPNGHILVFDNGTDLYCVNPSDPSLPAIFRGQTRITEYALDLTATPKPTATLVWSWAPPGKYSWFAGSAYRMPNDNTLIAWTADRNVLATEVDAQQPNPQKVWEIITPEAVAPLQRYTTYRAALISDLPDAIDPTITATVADNRAYVVGDVVTPSFRCTDRGGSNLQSCMPSGLQGGSLDTATVGAHTWQIEATDGDGNTRTLVRHYTVRSAGRLPDGLIRKGGSSAWKGGSVYGPATDQRVRQGTQRGHAATTYWRIQNDGERADTFTLTGTGSSARFRVRYYARGMNVTGAVVSGTFRTGVLAPGERVTLRVEVTPTRRALIGDRRTVALRATSLADATAVDRVATRVTTRR